MSVNCAIIVDRKDCADLPPPISKLVILLDDLSPFSRKKSHFIFDVRAQEESCGAYSSIYNQEYNVSIAPNPRVSRLMSICEIRRECWRVEPD